MTCPHLTVYLKLVSEKQHYKLSCNCGLRFTWCNIEHFALRMPPRNVSTHSTFKTRNCTQIHGRINCNQYCLSITTAQHRLPIIIESVYSIIETSTFCNTSILSKTYEVLVKLEMKNNKTEQQSPPKPIHHLTLSYLMHGLAYSFLLCLNSKWEQEGKNIEISNKGLMPEP